MAAYKRRGSHIIRRIEYRYILVRDECQFFDKSRMSGIDYPTVSMRQLKKSSCELGNDLSVKENLSVRSSTH